MCLLVERDRKPGAGRQVNRRDGNECLLHGIALCERKNSTGAPGRCQTVGPGPQPALSERNESKG